MKQLPFVANVENKKQSAVEPRSLPIENIA